jgi:hypothetical protein
MKKIIFVGIIGVFFTCSAFSQYVRGFSGAWYNQNGSIYIVNPYEPNRCEIVHVIIDNMFRVSQKPETGIVNAFDDTSFRSSNLEIIKFQNRTVRVKDVIYAPTAFPIDIFGETWIRDKNITIPQINDILSKNIYIEERIEIIREGTTSGYFELIDKLNNSRLIVFNNNNDSNKYIFKEMELISYGERFGEGDEIVVESYNDNEVIIKWEYYSSRGPYSGNYSIRVYYKIYKTPEYQASHQTTENLRIRVNPALGAETIIILPKGTNIQVLETGKGETIDGINANWVKIQTGNSFIGWCFSGYLQSI